MRKTRYAFAALAATFGLALTAQAGQYWLFNSSAKTLTLTDDSGAECKPVTIQNVQVDSGTELKKTGGNSIPYEGCAYGEVDLDLTLPIKDANGTDYTLVKLEQSAFDGSNNHDTDYIRSVKLPGTIRTIGWYAFRFCRYLKKFEWDTSKLESVGAQMFDSCERLEGYFTWPSQLAEVGQFTFKGTKIQGFYGPSVTSVGGSAFRECTSLKAIEFDKSVEFTGEGAFQSTTGAGYNVFFHDNPPVVNQHITAVTSTGGSQSNSVFDWWGQGNANATVYVPFNEAKNGPTTKWATFKAEFDGANEGNLITWPTSNGDGTWTDGKIYVKGPNKTVTLRFWDPDATTTSALLAY